MIKRFNNKYIFIYNIFTIILIIISFNSINSKQFQKFLSFKEEKISKKYKNLINYITSNGGYVNPKLIPNEISKSNRYIITTEKIKKDEILLFSPDIILISKLHSNVFKKCQEAFGFEEE